MIETYNLSKKYKEIVAIKDVCLNIQQGEVSGILGANGAGKTTLFKILTGLITADSGTFKIDSNKKKPIGAIIEKPALYEYLNAHDNLYLFSKMQGLRVSKKEIDQQLHRVGLSSNRKDAVKKYSLGMKQRLGIAVALINDPDCLILDEPFLGLDPLGMQTLRDFISELANEHQITVLISSHQLDEVSKVCDSLHIIRAGRLVQSGSTSSVLNSAHCSYTIIGKGLANSKVLKQHNAEINHNTATVELPASEAPDLIADLIEEGCVIESFTPGANIEEIYQNA